MTGKNCYYLVNTFANVFKGGDRVATLKDIADRLQLSVSTVSRVVNNKSYVNPKTRELVNKAIEEMGYTPNQIARSLKVKATRTIGVVVPDISEALFSNLIKGIDEVLSVNGYSIILCDTRENPAKEIQYLELLLEKQIDGVILATVSLDQEKNGDKKGTPPRALDRFFEAHIPVIFIDNLPHLSRPVDSVIIDNAAASSLAVNYLADLGHRKIGMISGKVHETTGSERLNGYKAALVRRNLPVAESLIAYGDYKEESGYRGMVALLERCPDMTAVYVASSKMTYGAIQAIRDRGGSVPESLSVVGFDVYDPTGLLVPGITTILQPDGELGQTAARRLIQRLQQGQEARDAQMVILKPQLKVRGSCRPLPER